MPHLVRDAIWSEVKVVSPMPSNENEQIRMTGGMHNPANHKTVTKLLSKTLKDSPSNDGATRLASSSRG
jgi:hypothetical protein